jgi:NAD+ synthetase
MTEINAATPSLLARLRASRGFDAFEVAEAKCGRLARWFTDEKLDAAVVGVSGGVDSAVVLALLRELQHRGVLRRVVGMLLPVDSRGATEQEAASTRGRLVAKSLGAEIWEAPLTEAHAATRKALSHGSGLEFDAWSEGQLLSVMRTPALYGAAALLQAHGYRSVVVGTTNRDEGSFLGFFGKGSDAMVDLQPISDLHKYEVRGLACHFGVPTEIVDAVPSGNVHDGRSDEEIIGASYDELELFLRLRELGLDSSPLEPRAIAAIQRHHALNRHKYRVGNPAVHLDVMPRGVPGGWLDETLSPRGERRPPTGVLPGEWDPPSIELDPIASVPEVEALPVEGLAIRVRDALTLRDCERLRGAFLAAGCAAPVGVTGVSDGNGIGSQRATAWSPELSRVLWQKLAPAVPSVRFLDRYSPADGFATPIRPGHRSWRVVGLSPLLRFMRYDRGGQHFAHYDAGFDYGDGRRTLLSVVFYLSDACESGATRFVRDNQSHMPVCDRDFSDWDRETRAAEVAFAVYPRSGDALLFDHRLCHDVQRWDGVTPRVIVRADVVFEVIPDDRP